VKVIILAGGKGNRAKPFTDFFPKAMIPVEGKPLIDYIVRYVSSFSFID
jgi:mannose-1-phosphate guanylyltransferase